MMNHLPKHMPGARTRATTTWNFTLWPHQLMSLCKTSLLISRSKIRKKTKRKEIALILILTLTQRKTMLHGKSTSNKRKIRRRDSQRRKRKRKRRRKDLQILSQTSESSSRRPWRIRPCHLSTVLCLLLLSTTRIRLQMEKLDGENGLLRLLDSDHMLGKFFLRTPRMRSKSQNLPIGHSRKKIRFLISWLSAKKMHSRLSTCLIPSLRLQPKSLIQPSLWFLSRDHQDAHMMSLSSWTLSLSRKRLQLRSLPRLHSSSSASQKETFLLTRWLKSILLRILTTNLLSKKSKLFLPTLRLLPRLIQVLVLSKSLPELIK